jgi:hypothetical protein
MESGEAIVLQDLPNEISDFGSFLSYSDHVSM